MNYIVFDLEWNQSPSGRYRENPRIPFEILEIGAVKLNSRRKKIGEFHETVKPLIYRTMNRRTQEIVHMDMDVLMHSRTFSNVVRSFLEWCGEDYMFVSWGPSDVFELQRNMDYYRIGYIFPKPFYYYDLQKLYTMAYLDSKKQPALQEAVEAMGLKEDKAYHSAFADAQYTAEIMQKMNLRKLLEYKSVDYYRLPETPEEEIFLNFKTYSKYVSRPFAGKEEALEDKTVSSVFCNRCGQPVKTELKWFSGGSGNMYYSLFCCPRHGYVKGKIRIRKAPGEKVFVVKTIKAATEENVEELRSRKEAQKEKRHKRLERERENNRLKKEAQKREKTRRRAKAPQNRSVPAHGSVRAEAEAEE